MNIFLERAEDNIGRNCCLFSNDEIIKNDTPANMVKPFLSICKSEFLQNNTNKT